MPISKIKSSAIDANAITGAGIADGAVDTADLANGAVTSAKLDTNIDVAGTLDVTGTLTADSNIAASSTVTAVGGMTSSATSGANTIVATNSGTTGSDTAVFQGNAGSYYNQMYLYGSGASYFQTNGTSLNFGTISNSPIYIKSNNANVLRIDSDGLKFGNDTAAANALDDYEEGTWTPIINDASYGDITTTTNHATYTKIGNLVYLDFYLTRNDSASATSTMFITNLPFGSLPASARIGGHAWWDNASSDWRTFIYLGGSSTSAYVLVPGNSSTYLTTNLFENGRYVYGSMCYRAS
jgi:hypothetical protein